jgi:hypothetical protein
VCLLCTSNKETSTGNIANLGLAVKSKGVTYYNKYEKGIFAVKNGKEEQLTDETAYSLNVVENKIYYIMVADFNNIVIKSIDIDGKNLKAIATIYTSISKIYIDDGYIYYATNNSGAGIARIDLNGQNETVIVSEKVQDFQVVNGNIYYINNSNQICKFNVKDENGVILSETITAKKIQVDGKWIYYYDENENALFRLSDNGSKNELVSVLINNEIYNISGKYVYYFDKENSKIARMQIGKSNKCDDIVNVNVTKTKINIVGDELYYLDKSKDESQTYQMYRVKINGSEAKSIEY